MLYIYSKLIIILQPSKALVVSLVSTIIPYALISKLTKYHSFFLEQTQVVKLDFKSLFA